MKNSEKVEDEQTPSGPDPVPGIEWIEGSLYKEIQNGISYEKYKFDPIEVEKVVIPLSNSIFIVDKSSSSIQVNVKKVFEYRCHPQFLKEKTILERKEQMGLIYKIDESCLMIGSYGNDEHSTGHSQVFIRVVLTNSISRLTRRMELKFGDEWDREQFKEVKTVCDEKKTKFEVPETLAPWELEYERSSYIGSLEMFYPEVINMGGGGVLCLIISFLPVEQLLTTSMFLSKVTLYSLSNRNFRQEEYDSLFSLRHRVSEELILKLLKENSHFDVNVTINQVLIPNKNNIPQCDILSYYFFKKMKNRELLKIILENTDDLTRFNGKAMSTYFRSCNKEDPIEKEIVELFFKRGKEILPKFDPSLDWNVCFNQLCRKRGTMMKSDFNEMFDLFLQYPSVYEWKDNVMGLGIPQHIHPLLSLCQVGDFKSFKRVLSLVEEKKQIPSFFFHRYLFRSACSSSSPELLEFIVNARNIEITTRYLLMIIKRGGEIDEDGGCKLKQTEQVIEKKIEVLKKVVFTQENFDPHEHMEEVIKLGDEFAKIKEVFLEHPKFDKSQLFYVFLASGKRERIKKLFNSQEETTEFFTKNIDTKKALGCAAKTGKVENIQFLFDYIPEELIINDGFCTIEPFIWMLGEMCSNFDWREGEKNEMSALPAFMYLMEKYFSIVPKEKWEIGKLLQQVSLDSSMDISVFEEICKVSEDFKMIEDSVEIIRGVFRMRSFSIFNHKGRFCEIIKKFYASKREFIISSEYSGIMCAEIFTNMIGKEVGILIDDEEFLKKIKEHLSTYFISMFLKLHSHEFEKIKKLFAGIDFYSSESFPREQKEEVLVMASKEDECCVVLRWLFEVCGIKPSSTTLKDTICSWSFSNFKLMLEYDSVLNSLTHENLVHIVQLAISNPHMLNTFLELADILLSYPPKYFDPSAGGNEALVKSCKVNGIEMFERIWEKTKFSITPENVKDMVEICCVGNGKRIDILRLLLEIQNKEKLMMIDWELVTSCVFDIGTFEDVQFVLEKATKKVKISKEAMSIAVAGKKTEVISLILQHNK